MKCTVIDSQGKQCKNDDGGGLCGAHAYRLGRYGDVQADRPIRKYSPRVRTISAAYEGDTEEERFWNRVKYTQDHWLWLGSMQRGTTPQTQWQGFGQTAVRVAWTIFYGDPGPGTRVVRTCDEKACVNPLHMMVEQINVSTEAVAA